MGLSLADAAVSGNLSKTTIAAQKQSLLEAGDTEGLLALNRQQFGGFTMMAKADDSDDTDDDGDDDEDEDDADDDDDDDEDEDDKGKKKDPRDVRIEELSKEAKKRRLRARALREENERLKAELAQKGSKGKKKDEDDEDDEDDESEATKSLKSENETLKQRLQQQTLRTEFNDILSQPKQKIKFKDPKVAFRLLDLDDVEIDEDGDVDGLEDAIKALAKEAPYLLVEDEKDEDDEDEDEKPKRRTGQRTGGSRKKGQPNEEALRKKYNIKR